MGVSLGYNFHEHYVYVLSKPIYDSCNVHNINSLLFININPIWGIYGNASLGLERDMIKNLGSSNTNTCSATDKGIVPIYTLGFGYRWQYASIQMDITKFLKAQDLSSSIGAMRFIFHFPLQK